jgi:restriction endonuclease Mrr
VGLIDGETLTHLVVDDDNGVAETYLAKRLHIDFFEEGD